MTCVAAKGGTMYQTTLSEFLKNVSFIPESPVTAAYASNGQSGEEKEVLYLYTADGFRHAYDYTIHVNGSQDFDNKTLTAHYHYNAQKSQNVSEMFGGRRVDAAVRFVTEIQHVDVAIPILIEISGYSLYQNGTYLGEMIPPCEREDVNNTGKPELLIRKN